MGMGFRSLREAVMVSVAGVGKLGRWRLGPLPLVEDDIIGGWSRMTKMGGGDVNRVTELREFQYRMRTEGLGAAHQV